MKTEERQLLQRFSFADLPADSEVVNVSIDWNGEPILLCAEGRPPRPSMGDDIDSTVSQWNSPPRAHRIIHWTDGSPAHLRVENPGYTLTFHAQRFETGWLLGEARGGATRIFDGSGQFVRTLDLGDASTHLQTTPDGRIWVGYFDEGVFGNGLGQAGAICFDSTGTVVFNYNDFAAPRNLPDIADCYTLNVAAESVWLCYYTDFPLVRLSDFRVARVWPQFGATKAIAVRGETFIRFPAYRDPFLRVRTFDSVEETCLRLIAPDGRNLSQLPPCVRGAGSEYVKFQVRARGSCMYIYDEQALYELP